MQQEFTKTTVGYKDFDTLLSWMQKNKNEKWTIHYDNTSNPQKGSGDKSTRIEFRSQGNGKVEMRSYYPEEDNWTAWLEYPGLKEHLIVAGDILGLLKKRC